MDTTRMRTWAEIDLSALEHNYRTLRAMLPQGCGMRGCFDGVLGGTITKIRPS